MRLRELQARRGGCASSRRGTLARAPREDRNEWSLALEKRRFWSNVMGLDDMFILHERGLAQTFAQATKHTALSKTCIQWALHEHTQATNHPLCKQYQTVLYTVPRPPILPCLLETVYY
jgi:hypothetical protein